MSASSRKRTTIVDVARVAGVAISSASAALNGRPGVSDATRKRILEVADELGFVPSLRGRSLSTDRAFTVGLVVQREIDVLEADPFFGAFIGGIEEVLAPRGYALVLQVSTGEKETIERYRMLALNRRVDGVFVNELRVDDPRVALARELDMPAVAVNPDTVLPLPSVRQDAVAPMRDLTGLLIGQGHRSIAHVAGPPEFVHSRSRHRAWEETMAAAGLDTGKVVEGDFSYRGGQAAARQLMTVPDRPTGVVCANDLMAVGFIRECQDLGLDVPGDVSVTGYDGIALGTYIRPTLTTARTSPRRLAAEAARVLLETIDGGAPVDREIPPAEIVLGESTAPARAAGRM
ncbi:LacI family DNA-binding transcriptional regulator [Actinomyces sp.]|uniref:LacI family DNA-binding transcriptional regulator n=1 Tax=Actinomyces sp. TaxID=29317 RepID=UPI0028986575|nr:LacI family DNA-binding transcriptional regulator [Actinomyces sp.]